MSPWEAAVQFEGRVDPAFEHIDAYKAAASHITLDDFVDDEQDTAEVCLSFCLSVCLSQGLGSSILGL